jgi:hypothetical protein
MTAMGETGRELHFPAQTAAGTLTLESWADNAWRVETTTR